jgi:hypothetical protein
VGAVLTALVVLGMARSGDAQLLGPFRWQLAPRDEFVTLTATPQGSVFVLAGIDELAGAPPAAVIGTAFVRADGMIGMGFTTVFDGIAAHTEVILNPSTLSGTWRDDGGNSGNFVPQ